MVLLGAVVLTGGTGARLGGVDKAGLELAGRTLVERALATVSALVEPQRVVVVGDAQPGVRSVREQPPGGGPGAGLLAGVAALADDVDRVLALAVDMPWVTARTLARVASYEAPLDGAQLVDAAGRRQPLCAAYDVAALLAAAPDDTAGLPLHRLLARLRLAEVAAVGDEADDVDTPADLARAAERAARSEGTGP